MSELPDYYDSLMTPPVFHSALLDDVPALRSFTTFCNTRPDSPSTSSNSTTRPLSSLSDMAALQAVALARGATLLIDPGQWDGHQNTYQLWWAKMQAWATP